MNHDASKGAHLSSICGTLYPVTEPLSIVNGDLFSTSPIEGILHSPCRDPPYHSLSQTWDLQHLGMHGLNPSNIMYNSLNMNHKDIIIFGDPTH